jgi:hypothetical protein
MTFVNTFLDDNPSEVIVFVYQVNNDVDETVDLNNFYSQLTAVDGFVDKLYVHPGPNVTWPTLRELTDPSFNKVSFRVTHRYVMNCCRNTHMLILFLTAVKFCSGS